MLYSFKKGKEFGLKNVASLTENYFISSLRSWNVGMFPRLSFHRLVQSSQNIQPLRQRFLPFTYFRIHRRRKIG